MTSPALDHLLANESLRHDWFRSQTAHLSRARGVSSIPRVTSENLQRGAVAATQDQQEAGDFIGRVEGGDKGGANLIGAHKSEIALLGPTSLGLNLSRWGLIGTWAMR